MKAVHFGAGNIGRGFIGLLLSRAGYEICFVDVNEALVNLLKQKGKYTVSLADSEANNQEVLHVTAINGKDVEAVARVIADADIVTTAVGVSVLKHIAEVIARGIEQRMANHVKPLQIIACENSIGGSEQLKEEVYSYLDPLIKEKSNGIIAFPNAAVDRIVPLQHHEDPLHVEVEPFYEWIVDRSSIPFPFEPVNGIHYVVQLEPYIERKLFTVNTGHCSAAYLGYVNGYKTIQEAIADVNIRTIVHKVMEETGAMLIRKHQFHEQEHQSYINKILKRFSNEYLIDEVVRVGRSPIRKLSPNDRLTRPVMLALAYDFSVEHLLQIMACALLFDAAEDPEAVELQRSIHKNGVAEALTQYTGIPENHTVHAKIIEHYSSQRRKEV